MWCVFHARGSLLSFLSSHISKGSGRVGSNQLAFFSFLVLLVLTDSLKKRERVWGFQDFSGKGHFFLACVWVISLYVSFLPSSGFSCSRQCSAFLLIILVDRTEPSEAIRLRVSCVLVSLLFLISTIPGWFVLSGRTCALLAPSCARLCFRCVWALGLFLPWWPLLSFCVFLL